jgi:hypothetical protein
MSKTINGKEYTQVLEELKEPFDSALIKILEVSKKPYLPIHVIKERMDQVLGVFGYDFTLSELQIVNSGDEQSIIGIGNLQLRNDEGEVVAIRSSSGGCVITKLKQTSKPVKVSNDAESAANDIFKRCAKLFGVGSEQLREMRKNPKIAGSTSVKTSNDSILFSAKIITPFSTNSKNGYNATVEIEGAKKQLIIWQDIQEIIIQTVPMDSFVSLYKPGTTLKFYGKLNKYGATEQVIMTNVYISHQK